MNAKDILFYGNRTLMTTLDRVPSPEWEREGVCGWWSIKNVLAHLASYEHVMVDVLRAHLDTAAETLHLDQYRAGPGFNDKQVDRRQQMSGNEVLAEYRQTHKQVLSLIEKVPVEERRQTGTIPWYGNQYGLDDFIVYTQYGHKREHAAQIAVFADTVAQEQS